MLAFVLIFGKWLSLLGMIAAAGMGWAAPGHFSWETHYLVGMISTFLYAFMQVMTTYYFIGMRTAVVRAVTKHDLEAGFIDEAQSIKRRVSRMGHFLPLFATASLILAGAVLFGKIAPWYHWVCGGITILFGITSGITEWHAFKQNAALFARVATAIHARPSAPAEATI